MIDPATPPSVSFAWLYTSWGGAEVQLLHLARYAPTTTDITIIAPRSTDAALRGLWNEIAHEWVDLDHSIAVSSVEVRSTQVGRLLRLVATRAVRSVETLRAGFEFLMAVRRLSTDGVVHVDIPPWSAFLALALASRSCPIILTWHTPLSLSSGPRNILIRAKLKLLGRCKNFYVVAASSSAQRDAARWFGRAIADIEIVPAGFDPAEIKSAHSTALCSDVIVGVGALIERKGVDIAIRAVRRLHDDERSVRLVWFGEGPARGVLTRLIEELDLVDSVQIVGAEPTPTHRVELLRTVAEASVYVQPSRLDGLPLATIEAMALARPVVATPVGAMDDLTSANAVSWVTVDNVDQLAEALVELLDDPALRDRLGEQGRAFVTERYNMELAAAGAYRFYSTALLVSGTGALRRVGMK
jgi:glycosyltransferase involved in cell wall biosynthesis